MATLGLAGNEREHRVTLRFTDGETAEGCATDLDLDTPEFHFRFDHPRSNTLEAIVPLASVKRILVQRDEVDPPVESDLLRKVALHFWDGEVLLGLLRAVPRRQRHGMTIELLSPDSAYAEILAVPFHALKAVFFLRSWDTRPPLLEKTGGTAHWASPRQDAPLIDLLSEIRGLRGLRHRGQISAVEYERRRTQVLERI